MWNVCYNCGEYRADKTIDPSGPDAICPICGHKHPFLRLPLLLVAGPSGAGKSTILHTLVHQISQAVLLDSDILWRPEFNRPETKYRDFFETWLRVCKNISQSGRPIVITRNGKAVAVLLAPLDDDDLETILLSRSPRFQALLEQSQKSIQAGKGLSEEEFWKTVEQDQS